MKKNIIIYTLLILAGDCIAQQNTNYTQYTLNDYNFNPAIAGSSKDITVLVGRRHQWAGFIYSPETNFASFTTSIGRKKRARNYWHGAGVYIEQDRLGLYTNVIANASYAIHLKLSPQYNISFGLAAGIRQVAVSRDFINPNDPIVASKTIEVVVPDITPGMYLYSKKIMAGIAVKNLYKNTLDNGSKMIGTTGSKLYPNAYFMFGRKIISGSYDFIFIPSVQVQTNFISIPSANLSFMSYYRKRVGLGINYRSQDALSLIVQFRLHSSIVFGFAYDFTTSRLRQAPGSNSTEIMFGFNSFLNPDNYDRQKGSNACPKFEL